MGVVDEPLSQLVTNSSNRAGSALHMSDLLGSLRKGVTNESGSKKDEGRLATIIEQSIYERGHQTNHIHLVTNGW